jgi:cell division septation protein DedD
MPDRAERKDEKGLSARYLILVFLMGVAACAVFFSLGFLVGYNERPSKTVSATEEVTPTGVVPPLVNPPSETLQSASKESPSTVSTDLPMERIDSPEPPQKAAKGHQDRSEEAALAKPPAAPVKSATKPASPRAPAKGSQVVEAGFTVQVAASRDKRDAEKLVKELRSRGFDVFVVTPQFSDAKDNLYRVQVGPFATREEAVRVRDRVAKEGFKPFIKH